MVEGLEGWGMGAQSQQPNVLMVVSCFSKGVGVSWAGANDFDCSLSSYFT